MSSAAPERGGDRTKRLERELVRLRVFVLLIAAFVAVPSAWLIRQLSDKFQTEMLLREQQSAGELVRRMDAAASRIAERESLRPFDDYTFARIVPLTNEEGARLERSPLSVYPYSRPSLGLIGYFQVDPKGRLSSPVLPGGKAGEPDPVASGVAPESLAARLRAYDELSRILVSAGIVTAQSAPDFPQISAASPHPSGDPHSTVPLDAGQIANVIVRSRAQAQVIPEHLLPESERTAPGDSGANELAPLTVRKVDTERFLVLRTVWREDGRYLQGMVLSWRDFFDDLSEDSFRSSPRMQGVAILASYRGVFFRTMHMGPREIAAEGKASQLMLARLRLAAPFDAIELVVTVPHLPTNPTLRFVGILAVLTFGAIATGLFAIYQTGKRQLLDAQERSDFVSAVTHELRTPLTAIRMYGELLETGHVESEQKRQQYYRYIVTETERLSRLIQNVLHLSHLTNGATLEPTEWTVAQLIEWTSEQIRPLAASNGFELKIVPPEQSGSPAAHHVVRLEADALSRVLLNLVDNAVKFSRESSRHEIELAFVVEPLPAPTLVLSVRDFGPGVPITELGSIFKLFYRIEDELRRRTPGTGIGLALVQELVGRMHGTISVENAEPGARFLCRFPLQPAQGDERSCESPPHEFEGLSADY